jgi:protein-S-isoprenylcysteine O-methyltransferase Ste14
MTLWQIDLIPWYVFGVYFAVNALRVKRSRAVEDSTGRLWHLGMLTAGCYLMFARATGVVWLDRRFIHETPFVEYVGIALTTFGVAFAIWARALLGTNWSAQVTIKVDHTLIVKGPYAYVRHPLYTGLLIGGLGTALVAGKWRALIGFALAVVGLSLKANKEEAMLRSEFQNDYTEYRRHTGFLLPGLRSVSKGRRSSESPAWLQK